MPDNPSNDDPAKTRQRLMSIRVIWIALLFGQSVFCAIIISMLHQLAPHKPAFTPDQVGLIWKLALLGIVLAFALGHFIRSQIYKRNWQGHAVTFNGYFSANIVMWSLIQGVLFFSVIIMLLTGTVAPMIWPAIAATALFLATFPTGKPLQPREPVFQLPGDEKS